MADRVVDISELGDAIVELVEEYTADVEAGIPRVLDETARGALKDLRGRCPRKTGSYAKGWTIKKEAGANGEQKRVIHNRTDYQIAHLLEHGHAKRNGGRVSGTPHIAPVADAYGAKLSEGLQRLVVTGGAQ